MAEGQLGRRFPPRLFSACLGALLAFGAAVGALLYLTGSATGGIFVYLGLAAACIALASLAWEVVVRRAPGREARPEESSEAKPEKHSAARPDQDTLPDLHDTADLEGGPPGAVVWIAFPVAIFFGLASLPFLVLVIYPPAEEYFTEPGRVTASISRDPIGLRLDLDFPESTTERGENLRINGQALPESYVRDHPDVFEWRDARTLSLRLEPLLRDLGLERIERIGINQLSGVARYTYRTGLTVPQQRVVVAEAP